MSSTPESRESDTALQTTLEENVAYVGLLTRVISWAVDVLLINLVAVIVGLGAELIVGHLSDHEESEATLPCDRGWRLRTLDGRLLRRILVDNGPDARFSRDAGSFSHGERGEGQASPRVSALDRDERRDDPVAVGFRADPVQAPGIPGLARPHAGDRGRTAVDRRLLDRNGRGTYGTDPDERLPRSRRKPATPIRRPLRRRTRRDSRLPLP